MAVSKSWSSDLPTIRRRRTFTLSEANRALPLVQRIVRDIVKVHEVATTLHGQLDHGLPLRRREEIEDGLEREVGKLNRLLDELKDIGCDLKDYRMGLIDFIGLHEGREVCLCWKLGEERIEHWHELHDGFAGRRPISLLAGV